MTEVCAGPRGHIVPVGSLPPYFADSGALGVAQPSGIDRDRVDRWRSAAGADDPGVTISRFRGRRGLAEFLGPLRVVSRSADGFEALVRVHQVGAITIVDALAMPCSVIRSRREVDPAVDAELVLLITSAPGRLSLAGRPEEDFRAGQLIILSTAEPATMTVDDICETVQLTVKASVLGRDVVQALRRSRPVSPDTALVRAATTFLRRFGQTAAAGTSTEATDVLAQSAAVGLLRSVLAQQAYRTHSVDDTSRSVRERTLQLVERRFADPDFAVADVARELHVSRRQLYRHFADSGESLAAVIAERRLEEVRILLDARPELRLTDVAARSGFSSSATMRNRFRAAFGVTPTEYRAGHTIAGAPAGRFGPGEVADL